MNTKDIQKLSFIFPTYQKDLSNMDLIPMIQITTEFIKYNYQALSGNDSEKKKLFSEYAISVIIANMLAEKFSNYYNVDPNKLANTEFRIIK